MRSIVRWMEFSSFGSGTPSSVQGGPLVGAMKHAGSNGRSPSIDAISFLARVIAFPPVADDRR
jgi:hypothetical protein